MTERARIMDPVTLHAHYKRCVPASTLAIMQTDRKTPLGELNWIFTAITDTIAWNVLPKPLFQKLFRSVSGCVWLCYVCSQG